MIMTDTPVSLEAVTSHDTDAGRWIAPQPSHGDRADARRLAQTLLAKGVAGVSVTTAEIKEAVRHLDPRLFQYHFDEEAFPMDRPRGEPAEVTRIYPERGRVIRTDRGQRLR